MKIVQVVGCGRIFGAESSLASGIAAMAETGADVRVCALLDSRHGPGHERFVADCESFGLAPTTVVARGRLGFSAARGLRAAVTDADVVHVHGLRATLHAAAVAGDRDFFVTHRGTIDEGLFIDAASSAALLAYRRARVVFVESRSTREFLVGRGVPADLLAVAYDPVASTGMVDEDATASESAEARRPTSAATRGSEGRIRLLYRGPLTYEAGVDILLKALAWTSSSDLSLDIVGEGPEFPRLERLAAELGLEDCVRFEPWRAAGRWLEEASAVVVAARGGALHPLIAAAMAAGRPVIASAVAGADELVDPDAGGVLVTPDDAGALAAALDAFAGNPDTPLESARVVADAAADRFSPDRWARAMLDVYSGGTPGDVL